MTDVLIVDDSPVVRKVVRRILEEMNVNASEATDGDQALAACSLVMPQAVLVDGNMPGLNGFDFVRRLRRMPLGDQAKVIFWLSEISVSQIARAIHAGANEVMFKPFDEGLMRSRFEWICSS